MDHWIPLHAKKFQSVASSLLRLTRHLDWLDLRNGRGNVPSTSPPITMQDVANLENKTALVTGGAKHLGKAIALAMARAGARVAFTYLHSAQEAAQTFAEIKNTGAQAMAVQCDVRDGRSISETVRSIIDQWS